MNLCDNALKFTPSGSIQVHVCLYQDATGSTNTEAPGGVCGEAEDGSVPSPPLKLLITVRDTGIGVAEVKKETIFRSFEQADSSMTRPYGGTGLGLAITAR